MTEETTPDRVGMARRVEAAVEDISSILERADINKLELPASEAGWARRDALAHIVYWHEICLWALRATMDGTYAPVDMSDVNATNAKAVEDKRGRSTKDLIGDFRRTGRDIVQTMLEVPDELWHAKARLWKWVDGTTLHHYPEHREDLAAAMAD